MGYILRESEIGNPWELDSLKFDPPKFKIPKYFDYHKEKCLIPAPYKQNQIRLIKNQYYDGTQNQIIFPFQKTIRKYTKILHYQHDHHLSYTNLTYLLFNKFHCQLTKSAALPFKKLIVNNKNLKVLRLNRINERSNKFIRFSKSLETVIIPEANLHEPFIPYSPNLKTISIKIFDLSQSATINQLLKLQRIVDGKPKFKKEKKQISFHFDLYSSHGEVKGQKGEKIGLLESFLTQKFQFPKEFDLGVNLESIPSNFMEFTDLLSSIDYLQISPPLPKMRLFYQQNSQHRKSLIKISKRILRLHFREKSLHSKSKTAKFLKCMTGVKVIDIPFIQEACQLDFFTFINNFNTSYINTVIIHGFELSTINKGLQRLIDNFLMKFQDLTILEIQFNDAESGNNVIKEKEIISRRKELINIQTLRLNSLNHTTQNYYALLSIVNLQSIHDLYIQIWDTNLEEILDKRLNQMPNLKDLCIEIYNGDKVTHLAKVDWQNINLNFFSLSVTQNYNEAEQFMKNLLKKINSKRVEIQYRQILQEHVKQVSRVILDEEGISDKIQHLTLNLGNYDKSGNLRELAKTIFYTVKNLQTLEFRSGLFVIAYLQREVYSDARKRILNIVQ